jgi:hypothetical protein
MAAGAAATGLALAAAPEIIGSSIFGAAAMEMPTVIELGGVTGGIAGALP